MIRAEPAAISDLIEVLHRWVDGPDVTTSFELRAATARPLAIGNLSYIEAADHPDPREGSSPMQKPESRTRARERRSTPLARAVGV
jgi:hypothetical protein